MPSQILRACLLSWYMHCVKLYRCGGGGGGGLVAPFPKESLSLESLTLNCRRINIFAANSTLLSAERFPIDYLPVGVTDLGCDRLFIYRWALQT